MYKNDHQISYCNLYFITYIYTMKQIGQQEFDTAIAQGIVVVDFFATRC